MSYKTIFLLLSFIYLIQCAEENNTNVPPSTPKEEVKTEEKPTETKPEEQATDNKNKTFEIPKINYPPLEMTNDEMDIYLACISIVQEALKKDRTQIDEAAKRMGLNQSNSVIDKAGTEMFEQCVGKLNITVANKFFVNLTYVNTFQWDKSFDDLVKNDYTKYVNKTDLMYTPQQSMVMYKFQKVNELYRRKLADNRRNYEQSDEARKIKIGNFDINSLPTAAKVGLFLTIFSLFFLGTLYLLKSLKKEPKDKKNKKNKKKTQ